jgi:hypothetical protein
MRRDPQPFMSCQMWETKGRSAKYGHGVAFPLQSCIFFTMFTTSWELYFPRDACVRAYMVAKLGFSPTYSLLSFTLKMVSVVWCGKKIFFCIKQFVWYGHPRHLFGDIGAEGSAPE